MKIKFIPILLFLALSLLSCDKMKILLGEVDPNSFAPVYVNGTTGDDANEGTVDDPLQTIQAGIDKAVANKKNTVCVAQGTYSQDYNSTMIPLITMVEGISVVGGYSSDFLSQDSGVYTTILSDTSSAGGADLANANRVIQCNSTISRITVIRGFTINGGGGSYTCTVYNNGGSPTIENNIINGGNSSNTSVALYNTASSYPLISNNEINIGSGGGNYCIYTDGSSPTIEDNTIDAVVGGNIARGIYCTTGSSSIIRRNYISMGTPNSYSSGIEVASSGPHIYNNIINGGTAPIASRGIMLLGSTAYIRNNTIDGGAGATNVYALYIGMTDNSVIQNNIIFTTGGTNRHGIYEGNSGADPALVSTNVFFDCPTSYYYDDDTTTPITVIANVNALSNADSNIAVTPSFVNFGGGDWHVTGPVAVTQGGINGFLAGWGFADDKDGTGRSSPWTIGAYEE